jgi:hypothetical protein
MMKHTTGTREQWLAAAVRGASNWVCLAAAPTFAVMALLTGLLGGGAQAMSCMGAHDVSPLSGMTFMYTLMSAFHSVPWLKLISRRRSSARRFWSGVRQAEFKSPRCAVDRLDPAMRTSSAVRF